MNRTTKIAALVILAFIGLHATAGRTSAQTPNVVVQWNRLGLAQYGPGGSPIQRTLSMLHIAMFDAINSIERVYTPYRTEVKASSGASTEAAAAPAGHDVLSALFPAQQATFDAVLAAQLNGIPPGRAKQGVRVGQLAA